MIAAAPRRRGIAPLEFVFVFPLLLALTAALFLIARADVTKSFAATDARHQAWKARPSAPAGETLRVTADAAASFASRTTTRPVEGGPLFPGGFQAESHDTVFANPWDHRDVPFGPGQPTLEPHLGELGMVAGQIPGLDVGLTVTLKATALTLDPKRDPALIAFAVAGIPLNFAVMAAADVLMLTARPAILKTVVLPLEVAIAALEALDFLLPWESKELKKLKKVLRMVKAGLSFVDNLHEASRGRPGLWLGDLIRDFEKIKDF